MSLLLEKDPFDAAEEDMEEEETIITGMVAITKAMEDIIKDMEETIVLIIMGMQGEGPRVGGTDMAGMAIIAITIVGMLIREISL